MILEIPLGFSFLFLLVVSGEVVNQKDKNVKTLKIRIPAANGNSGPIKIHLPKSLLYRRKKIIKCCGFKKCLPPKNGTTLIRTASSPINNLNTNGKETSLDNNSLPSIQKATATGNSIQGQSSSVDARTGADANSAASRELLLLPLQAQLFHQQQQQQQLAQQPQSDCQFLLKKATRNEAALKCKAMNMVLLAVTSLEEMDCLSSFRGTMFWTSGSNEDFKCDLEKKYAWCSTGFNISTTLIASDKFLLPTTAAPSTLDRCLAFLNSNNTSQRGMVHRKCDDTLPFICQLPVECPKLCEKDASLFDADMILKNKSSYGFWIDIGTYTYLLGNKPMKFMANYEQCCALGMEALNLDNKAEQLGLTNLTIVYNNRTWKANFNYWTSGTQNGSPQGHWSWCEPNGPTVFPPGLTWERGQPDNKNDSESCVHFRFILNSTGTIMTDRSCESKLIFACKSNNWAAAWQSCCNIGLTLASLESIGKYNCLTKVTNKYPLLTSGDFWVSGTVSGCESNFRWCSLNREFVEPEIKWKAGHPMAGLDCVYLEVRNGSMLLATANCIEKKDFLCDVRKNSTTQKGMQAECADLWNITPEQIDLLLNISVFLTTTISLDLKFEMGRLNSIATLRQIELISQEEPQIMEKGFTAFDECSGKSRNLNYLIHRYLTFFLEFDDECVTAYETYKCGQEKEPIMVSNIVKNNFGNATVQTAIDVLYNSSTKTDYLGQIKTYQGKKYYVGLGDAKGKTNVTEVFKHCCELGFRLWEPQTVYEISSASSLGISRLFYLLSTKCMHKCCTVSTMYNILVGQTESINQTHEVWCNSRTLVPDKYTYPDVWMKFPCQTSIVGITVSYATIGVSFYPDKSIHDMFINPQKYNLSLLDVFSSFVCVNV
ncbi:Hypothetical predicted protein [Cloeon dipterum]|uniref:C-type lectin domain-containing protein n=1 Tax=Cloeon dipterum TaxID=197152 RepID=A0A8S1CQA0_9INSE|nr:Hypothetical predicted protein [Cloeon dipterum]